MKNLLLAAALTLGASSAFAGAKANSYVTILPQYQVAIGAVGSARNSPDGIQQIGCGVYVYQGSNAYVSCSAIDARSSRAWCVSSNPEFVKAGQSIGSDSDVEFDWDTSGNCIGLYVTNNSTTAPKAP